MKITERRKPRIEAKLKVALKGKDETFETFMGNISQSGIFLETPNPIGKIGEKVGLLLSLTTSKEQIGVTGKIVRVVGPNQVGKAKGVGIEILKVNVKKTFLFNQLLEELLSARGMGCRKSPRIDARITVEFSNPSDMGKCLSNNLSRGGIFIQTKAEFNLGETVSVILIHPVKGETLELDGEIVHIRKSLETHVKLGFTDGIGIKFTDLTSVKEAKINQFLKNLLIQKKKRKPRINTEQ